MDENTKPVGSRGEEETTGNFIDIEKVIGEKNPRLLKMLPGFIIRYLKRVLHQDDLNAFIRRYGSSYGLDFADDAIEFFGIRIEASGLENIPEHGRCVIASNHPLGGLDGIALITVAAKVRKDIIFPVNDFLMNVKNLEELFIPVNKHGSNAENIALFDQAFQSDKVILYFPAGLVSRKQKKGVIKDLEWKKTFISKARKSKRDIVPAHIEAYNTNFFYNLARFRKKIGVKLNVEMLYLVDEMYKQKGKTMKITFGKPISIDTFDKSNNDAVWASKVKDYVYRLESEPGLVFNAK